QEEPSLNFDLIALPVSDDEARQAVKMKLSNAGVIVGPWSVAVGGGKVEAEVAQAVVNSPARKIMIPVHMNNWDWAGVDAWDAEGLLQQTARAIRQWTGGEEIKAVRPMGVGGIIGMVLGVLLLLLLLAIPVLFYFVG